MDNKFWCTTEKYWWKLCQRFEWYLKQEVQKVFPECVKENEDGYLSLDLHPILVSYINGFKELNEKNVKMQLELNETKLQTQMQLNELKQQNDILSKRLNAIENK